MESKPPLEQLPEAHSLALRLEQAGADTRLIARVLGIETVAVPPLLEVAHRKWVALESQHEEKS